VALVISFFWSSVSCFSPVLSRLVPADWLRTTPQRRPSTLYAYICFISDNNSQGRRSLWDRGTRPPSIWTGGHYHECPPQYFWSNISYFLSMQYFLDKLKEFLVAIVYLSFFLLCKCNRKYYERNVIWVFCPDCKRDEVWSDDSEKKIFFFQPDVIF